MADWEEPLDSQTDPDAPITSQLGKRWDNNVVAMAEGAAGAPRVQGIALGGISMGFVSAGDTSNWVGYKNCENFGLVVGHLFGNFVTSSGGLLIRFSNNNGSTWGGQIVLSTVGTGIFNGVFRVNLEDGAWFLGGTTGSVIYGSGTAAIPSGVNAFQVRGFVGAMDAFCLGGRT